MKINKINQRRTSILIEHTMIQQANAELNYKLKRRQSLSMENDPYSPNNMSSMAADPNQKFKLLLANIKQNIVSFLDSTLVTVFMTLVTIYALYFDDIRILFFPKSADDVFYGITLIGMICFAIEIILASFAKEDYIFSFFFYLDIVSTLSMIPDCGWIWNAIIDSGNQAGNADSATDLAKTSRASKVTRVIRIIRLIRLIRIVKLYKQKQLAQKKLQSFANKQIVPMSNSTNKTAAEAQVEKPPELSISLSKESES